MNSNVNLLCGSEKKPLRSQIPLLLLGYCHSKKKMFVLWLVIFCFCFILVAHFHYYFMHFSKAPRKQDCVFNGKEWINLNL